MDNGRHIPEQMRDTGWDQTSHHTTVSHLTQWTNMLRLPELHEPGLVTIGLGISNFGSYPQGR